MNILIIVDVIDNGGVGIVLKSLLHNMDITKHRIELMTFEKNAEHERQLPSAVKIRHIYPANPAKHPNKVVRYAYGYFREICPKWLIRLLFIRKQYDLAIDFKGNNLNFLTAVTCPKLFWSHKDFSPLTNPIEKKVIEEYSKTKSGAAKERLFKENLRRIDGVICISDACKKAFAERWQYPTDRITTLLNILDVPTIQEKAKAAIPYTKPDTFTFCCMSRISAGKGIERLLACVAALNDEGHRFVLNIVGGGDTLDDMIALSRQYQLENVRFFGNQENPYPYVLQSDVFVYPSETEAYSTAVCEALILGMPIITTKTASVPEIFGDSEYGIVVENSQDAILEGMRRVLTDARLVTYYQEQAKKRLAYFDVKTRTRAIEEYIDGFETNT